LHRIYHKSCCLTESIAMFEGLMATSAEVLSAGNGNWIAALLALAALEIVLGIDNIVFIAIVTSRLPPHQQPLARRLGLFAALGTRILLLLLLKSILQLVTPMFHLTDLGIPAAWFEGATNAEEINGISGKDLILLAGGLFLIGKSVHEIHVKLEEGASGHTPARGVTFAGALIQIALLDVIFSLDSVITAVGMADQLWVMIVAIILAVGVMLMFAGPVSSFVTRHPTLKILALSFLILIGVMLVAEGIGSHLDKRFIYFAMAFALGVEFVNLRVRSGGRAAHS